MSDHTWADVDRDAWDNDGGGYYRPKFPEDYVQVAKENGRSEEEIGNEIIDEYWGNERQLDQLDHEIEMLQEARQEAGGDRKYWREAFLHLYGEELF